MKVFFSSSRFEMESEVFAISKELMMGSGEALFDHIAACLANFAKSRGLDQEVNRSKHFIRFVCTIRYS